MKSFKEKLMSGKFVHTTEIGPPKGVDFSSVLTELECVKFLVDAVNVTDQQSAVMRLGSIASSRVLIDNGFEPICQVTTRDRNRIALQSDLLSAFILGVRNIMIMTGDHPILGDHPSAKPVYDLDAITLLSAIKVLESGFDLAGKKLNASPSFLVGGVVNPGADPLEPEIIKMEKKIENGAMFFQTQSIFELGKFEKFINSIKHFRSLIKILGGIVPLRSAKMARYMNDNIPGVSIPENIITRIDKALNIEEESVLIASEIMREIKGMCDGIHFMPIRSNHLVAKILDIAGVRKGE
ncbi:5,10-methylenetetrahydrofolate reductase [Candidatus Omnitrophus magneticus]|uniref:Methylenetetrahydrofolate reductase n=1 Tax=Candidatus Omnitrophus magneticus TaxID=1609969 RepID=A0A0F0CMK8_9BACT|nr:5,10-methylenetetrahydrofolate reductase [Candidatus Omnitrophus magneticus]